jgi:ABC-type nickel/cobalt efflux system permease component RcnA
MESSGPTGSARPADEGISGLLRTLADQSSHLVQQQVQLVQAEVRESVADVKLAVGAMAGAAIVGIAGLGVLLMAFAYLLAEAMELWLATLIVALVTLLGAYILYRGGMKKIQDSAFHMDRTKRTLERTPDAVTSQTSTGNL